MPKASPPDRGPEYWDRFYASADASLDLPSSFAQESLGRISPDDLLMELGCGNGRDALFFAADGVRVLGCDQSETAIQLLNERVKTFEFNHAPVFLVADFARLGDEYGKDFDVVYSRFTLHAVPKQQASRALLWSHTNLRPGGMLLIEARSVAGSLYGKGRPLEPDAFLHDGHYRRFLRMNELCKELREIGFEIQESVESDGLAVYRDDDPVVIRIVALRRD